MINYNPKEWFTFIFRFHKADTFRKLFPLMIAVSLYGVILAYLELEYWSLNNNSYVKNLSLMHSVLGFVISLLLVFRTNTAYDRWWEGRKQWGTLVNVSRNLSIKLAGYLQDKSDKTYFSILIPVYARALRNHLRGKVHNEDIKDIVEAGKTHIPNQIALKISERIYALHKQHQISSEQLIILTKDVDVFTDVCGACERIKNTPIPFSYNVFIKKFIFFYVMTLPIGWVFSFGYFVVLVVVFVLYVFASLELIAEEIEDPFGSDANDLPLDVMCDNIEKHVKEILN
ncbi:bestrophin family ion channel [Pseudopedobacter sp.]|uniref:bestrophin family protein n=1 Tax=Pseudopedobacter sp. TaxID=1936787 RepID=UPI0033411349